MVVLAYMKGSDCCRFLNVPFRFFLSLRIAKAHPLNISHLGVPPHGSVVTNPPTSIHENVGLIPGLAQWVKDLGVAMRCGVGQRRKLRSRVAMAVAQASSWSSEISDGGFPRISSVNTVTHSFTSYSTDNWRKIKKKKIKSRRKNTLPCKGFCWFVRSECSIMKSLSVGSTLWWGWYYHDLQVSGLKKGEKKKKKAWAARDSQT